MDIEDDGFVTVTMSPPAKQECQRCHGQGYCCGEVDDTCPVCHGDGTVESLGLPAACPECQSDSGPQQYP